MSTSVCWELTCDGLMSRPGRVKDFHPLNTMKTGDRNRLGSEKDLVSKFQGQKSKRQNSKKKFFNLCQKKLFAEKFTKILVRLESPFWALRQEFSSRRGLFKRFREKIAVSYQHHVLQMNKSLNLCLRNF